MGDKKNIFIAGHKGMVGSAILRHLEGFRDLNLIARSRSELDLLQQSEVNSFFNKQHIDEVYLAAARVGGIYANNTYPAQFIHENLVIQTNVINAAYCNGVKRLIFLGSSCIYPKFARQPMRESDLLTGQLEPTNEPYAIAKIAGIKMCESYNRQYGETNGIDYRSVMPTNLYGIGDNYHPENSHVLPALIRKFHEAKVAGNESVCVWGSGKVMREFLNVDDLASACVFVMGLDKDTFKNLSGPHISHVNIGSGKEISIRDLAIMVKNTVGFNGKIEYDSSKPEGTPRKLLDTTLLNSLGWSPKIDLKTGLHLVYQNFKKNFCEA